MNNLGTVTLIDDDGESRYDKEKIRSRRIRKNHNNETWHEKPYSWNPLWGKCYGGYETR